MEPDKPPAPEPDRHEVADAVDNVLQPLNLPNTFARLRAVGGMVTGLVLVLAGVIFGIVIHAHSHRTSPALVVFGIFALIGLMTFVFALISYRQLTKFIRAPRAPYTQFQTNTAVSYQGPLHLPGAVVSQGETVGEWFGPVMNPGMSGSYQLMSREVDREAVNTLLFTTSQMIGLMLGPDDLRNLRGSGPIKTGVNEALKYVGEAGYAKGVQFEALNSNHWDQMVDALMAESLEAALANHLHFGLPYDRIQYVDVKHHLVNPGFSFHLTDGSHIRYATFKKDRLPEIASYLKQFVTVHS